MSAENRDDAETVPVDVFGRRRRSLSFLFATASLDE
jgi:hypothetical protein